MNDSERRRYECFIRIRQFGTDNAADFAAIPVAVTNFGVITTEVEFLDDQGADQQEGFGDARGATETKGTARENLREEMSDIARTARSMEYQFDGISDRFRMPVVRNVYKNDVGKLAAWTSASHSEKAPKKTETPPTA